MNNRNDFIDKMCLLTKMSNTHKAAVLITLISAVSSTAHLK